MLLNKEKKKESGYWLMKHDKLMFLNFQVFIFLKIYIETKKIYNYILNLITFKPYLAKNHLTNQKSIFILKSNYRTAF